MQIIEYTIQSIKKELLTLGYPCEDFFNLNEASFDNDSSSRELLIAIGWIFNYHDIIETFFENSSSICEREYFEEFATNVNIKKKFSDLLKISLYVHS